MATTNPQPVKKGLSDRLGYARSLLVTAPLIFLATIVMGSLSLFTSLFDASGKMQHGCAKLWARAVLSISRVKVIVYGGENILPGASYVFCVNHQSHMDIPIVLAALPFAFRFASKKEHFRVPFLGWHLRRSGHIPIDRENPRAALRSLRDAEGEILRGKSLAIFPEGGTSADGRIKPFKRGGFFLATRAHAGLVPVTVRGSRAILVPKTYHVRGGAVEVFLGTPVPPEGASPAELALRIREEIVRTFGDEETLDRNTYTLSR